MTALDEITNIDFISLRDNELARSSRVELAALRKVAEAAETYYWTSLASDKEKLRLALVELRAMEKK